jgi:hypothetical protein
MSNTRSLGNMVIRLAVELAKYKADWSEAVSVTKDGAAKIDSAASGATTASDRLTEAARRQTGALGEAASQARDLVDGVSQVGRVSLLAAAGLTTLAAAGAAMGYAYYQGYLQTKQLNDSLLLTGNYAGLVAGQIDTMALSVANGIGGKVSASREVLQGLVSTGKFTVDSLGEVATAVQLVARYSTKTNAQVLQDFAGMGDGVAKWAAKANEAYHFLDIETYRYIQQLEAQDKVQEAARVTSEALSKHLGGDLNQNLNWLGQAWAMVARQASNAWEAMVNSTKAETLQQKLTGMELYLEQLQLSGQDTAGVAERVEALRAQVKGERDLATAKAGQADATQKAIAADETWGKLLDRNLTRQEQLTRELDKARKAAAAVVNRPAADVAKELAAVEEQIRARYAVKERKTPAQADPYKALLKSAEERVGVLRLEQDATEKVTESEKLRAKYMADLAGGYIAYNEASDRAYMAVLAEMGAQERANLVKAEAEKLREREIKATGEAEKAYQATAKAEADRLDKLKANTVQQQQENAALGQGKTAIAELEAARLEEQATLIEGLAIKKLDRDLDYAMYEVYKAQANELRALAQLKREGAGKEVSLDAAKETAREWKRTGDFIKNTLYDSLQRGFEDGQTFSRAFFKSLEAVAKTTTLRFGVELGSQALGFSGTGSSGSSFAGSAAASALQKMGWDKAGNLVPDALNAVGMGNVAAGAAGVGGSFASTVGAGLATDAMGATVIEGAAAATLGTGSGIGAAMAAIPGWGWALAGAALLSGMGSKGGPKTMGGGDLAAQLQAQYDATAQQLGIGRRVRFGAFSAQDPEGDSLTQLQVAAHYGDQVLYDRAARTGGNYENVARGADALAAAEAEERVRALFMAIKSGAGELSTDIKGMFDAVSEDASVTEMQAVLERATTARSQRAELESRLFDLQATDEQKLARARDTERKAMDATNRELLEQVYAQEDLARAAASTTKALRENALEAVDRAYDALQAGTDRERTEAQRIYEESMTRVREQLDAVTANVSKLSSLNSALKSSLGRYQTDSLLGMTRGEATAQIARAAATVRAGGAMPEADSLTNALQVLAQPSMGLYTSFVDYARAFDAEAAVQADLNTLAEAQLSTEERTLRELEGQSVALDRAQRANEQRLDGILEQARLQVNSLNGVNAQLGTVAQLLSAFQVVAAAAGQVVRPNGAVSAADIGAWVAPRLGVSEEMNRALYNDAAANRERGVTLDKIDAAGGLPPGTSAAWAVANGLPTFARGTNSVSHDMIAQIHAAERIVPAETNRDLLLKPDMLPLLAVLHQVAAEVRLAREYNTAENTAVVTDLGHILTLQRKFDVVGVLERVPA